MSLDASGEVYFLPFRPSNDSKFSDLCGKSASLTLSESDVSKELLEIRITDMSSDFNEATYQHGRPLSDTANNDDMSVVKHEEIDLETLNRLLTKEVVCLSSVRSADSSCVLQTRSKQQLSTEEVRGSSAVPVVMYAKELCMLDNDVQSSDHAFENDHVIKLNGDINLAAEQENLTMYSNEENILNSVEVLDLEHSDENVWISDPSLLSLSSATLDSSSDVNHPLDLAHAQLVPVKVEDSVVYINVAPSSRDLKPFSQSAISDKQKPAAIDRSLSSDSLVQNRPSVISVAAKSPLHSKEQHEGIRNSTRISSDIMNHEIKMPSSSKSLLNKSGFYSLFKPKLVSSKNSRSVLKASVARRQKSFVPLKPKSEISDNNEEPVSSIFTRSIQTGDLKNSEKKFPRFKGKKPQSLAVVAISSDKTKDLTEIVVSTSKGEQIFKGKTSELISATPSLWCLNSSKVDISTSLNPDYTFRGHEIGLDDEETIDDQPVTDALRRLGIPTLQWVQNNPEDERMWFCPERDCKRLFPRLHLLKVHILGHYGVRPYKCDFPNCQWAFYTHFKLKRHKETHLQRKDFKCPVPDCGRSFSTVYNLNTHQKLHKRPAEISCPVGNCPELFQTRRSLEFHLRQHGEDHAPYICPYSTCQKRYYTVNSVNSHIRSHQHKDDEIKCQWAGCSKVFNKPCRLKAHMRTHTGDKPYPCNHPGCNWAFSSSSKLKRHQHKHTNVRNFECPLEGCGKLFMRSEHLKEHILTHSSERTFKCPHPNCNVKFSAKSSLYVHSKKHKAKLHSVPDAESSVDALSSIPVNVIKTSGNHDGGGMDCSVQNDIPEINMKKAAEILTCPVEPCGQSFVNELDLREHVNQAHSVTAPIDIPAASQTLDLIPLLSEDEALVAELASMDPVPFASDSDPTLRAEDSPMCSSSLENPSNDVLNTLSEYMDEPGASNNLEQVVICSLDVDEKPLSDPLEQSEDLDLVLNPASARSSITLHSWIEFKKHRQRQAIPSKQQRQSKRQASQTQKVKKHSPMMQSVEEDHQAINVGRTTNEGLSNLRAPLDVVLGAGLLGSGLLLPDDLAASSDMYSVEDGILSMDSSFVPSTINLRDLE